MFDKKKLHRAGLVFLKNDFDFGDFERDVFLMNARQESRFVTFADIETSAFIVTRSRPRLFDARTPTDFITHIHRVCFLAKF